MKWTFDARIRRAAGLAEKYPAPRELLDFYSELVRFQSPIFETLRARAETGVRPLSEYFPALLDLVAKNGPPGLAENGRTRVGDRAAGEELLQSAWTDGAALDTDPCSRFFARVLLQPYAEYLASRGDVQADPEGRLCPFCSARPVCGVLRGEGDGAKRWLLCGLCATEWPYRRVLCWNCGEQDREKLPIYTAREFPAIRVDACNNCRTYFKSIDLTTDGHAVPPVDEIAAVALDLWAEENGYSKLEPNLLGM
jgi:FdhE protein